MFADAQTDALTGHSRPVGVRGVRSLRDRVGFAGEIAQYLMEMPHVRGAATAVRESVHVERSDAGLNGDARGGAERESAALRSAQQVRVERRRDPRVEFRAAFGARYRIEREVGRGAHGHVLHATDLRHNRAVAIKVLRLEPRAAGGSARFLREIRLVASLHHPHILPLYDSGCARGIRYYVMPLIEGDSLRQRVQRDGRLSVREALDVARQVASALVEAHRRGIVHRDIKPENILLSRRAALLGDFGIACAMNESDSGELTASGAVLGTPAYMSPEQGAPGERIDGRADVYSLGCVLYEMLVGTPPFTGDSTPAILAQHAVAPPPDVMAARPDASREVSRLVQRALAKNPDDRFDACAFEAALDAAMTCLAPGPPPAQGWRRRGARVLERIRAALR